MAVEVAMNTPLAEALHRQIQPKLVECGWAPSDASDTTMTEYLILMIVNGKTEPEIAAELSSDLLNLPPEDDSAKQFARWLFELIETENANINGPSQDAQPEEAAPSADEDMDMDLSSVDFAGNVNAPTGPKAMRNGAGFRGARDKRMLGQINRSMDRSNDSVLHRVRGTDRINSHGRGGPMGMRGGGGGGGGFGPGGRQQQSRNMNGRGASGFNQQAVAAAMAAGGAAGMPWMGPPGQPPMQPGPMDVYAMLEQQSRMMQQMQEQMQQQQQLMQQGGRRGGFHNQNHGRPLADRIHQPNQSHRNNFRNGGNFHAPHSKNGGEANKSNGTAQDGNGETAAMGSGGAGEDMDMGSEAGVPRELPNPAETVCKFNLHCTNKDCKFAHQSPAAPPGVTVDVHDQCPYGAACKNKKCVARHPSPAARMAHQSEQDCKFFPNCANPHCPFRHPSMPLCRNGGDCSVPGCKFTHIKTLCKYHPCTNRYCTFKHEEGQRGVFPDKVWTAEGGADNNKDQTHISERKFVDDTAEEEKILPGFDKDMTSEEATIA